MRTVLKTPFADNYVSKAEGSKRHLKGSTGNPMSDAELRRRKKLQSRLSLGGSVLGLSGLGTIIAASAVRKNPKMFNISTAKKVDKFTGVPYKNHEQVAQRIKDKGYILGSTAGGIGGIGGINFAAIQRQESRQRRNQTVKKSDYSIYQQQPPKYSPKVSRTAPDPERSRKRRQIAYTPALAAAGTGLIVGRNQIGDATHKLSGTARPFSGARDAMQARIDAERQTANRAARKARKKSEKAQRKFNLRQNRFLDTANKYGQHNPKGDNLRPGTQRYEEWKKEGKRLEAQKKKRQAKRDKAYFKSDRANTKAQRARSAANRIKDIPAIKPLKHARKAGKYGAVGLGSAALVGSVANEYNRTRGGATYKGHWDKFKNQ